MFESAKFVFREQKPENGLKQLYTCWGKELDPGKILPEYPRPQFMRKDYESLNGSWDFAICKAGEKPGQWDGTILVPFSPESVLSGVGRQLQPDEWLWYHRKFLCEKMENSRYLLHFGAVDQCCAVYINGKMAVRHKGGYTPFSADMTSYLKEGQNHITVCVSDRSDTSFYARGKQKLQRGGMYYTAQSGIWQSVWVERVPEQYIEKVDINTDPGLEVVRFKALIKGISKKKSECCPEESVDFSANHLKIRVFAPGICDEKEFSPADDPEVIAEIEAEYRKGDALTIRLPIRKRWSPEEPWLYYYQAVLGEDEVTGYFALRTFSVEKDEEGIPRFCLNHKPYFLKGVLDQGYWPDGLYTAPSDEALLFDIREMKKTGYNMARKHAKVEADRWYYHCDRLGMIVWQDIVNGGTPYKDWFVTYLATFLNWAQIRLPDRPEKLFSREGAAGKAQFEREMQETVAALRNHPSIAAWTLFNEGWGQFDTVKLTEELKKADPERLVDSASGWFDQGCGDFISIHHYFLPLPWHTDGKRAVVLSEIGGYALHDPEHSACENTYGYRNYDNREELRDNYNKLLSERENLKENGLSGYVYTQWSDIEEEVNGIYTYDRAVRKITP